MLARGTPNGLSYCSVTAWLAVLMAAVSVPWGSAMSQSRVWVADAVVAVRMAVTWPPKV